MFFGWCFYFDVVVCCGVVVYVWCLLFVLGYFVGGFDLCAIICFCLFCGLRACYFA